MNVDQILQQEESTYKQELKKRIELINWVLENMKNPNVDICSLIESRINDTLQEIDKKDSIFKTDILDTELRTLDWIFYQVCKDQPKKLFNSL